MPDSQCLIFSKVPAPFRKHNITCILGAWELHPSIRLNTKRKMPDSQCLIFSKVPAPFRKHNIAINSLELVGLSPKFWFLRSRVTHRCQILSDSPKPAFFEEKNNYTKIRPCNLLETHGKRLNRFFEMCRCTFKKISSKNFENFWSKKIFEIFSNFFFRDFFEKSKIPQKSIFLFF